MRRLIGALLLLTILVAPATAVNYHLDWDGDGVGGDDTAVGTSIANAWLTLRHAQEVMQYGDTLLVEPGTYTYTIDRFDSPADNITIKNRYQADADSLPIFLTRGFDPLGDANDDHRIFRITHNNVSIDSLVFMPDSANAEGQQWCRMGVEVIGDNFSMTGCTFEAGTDSSTSNYMFKDIVVIRASANAAVIEGCTLKGAGNPNDPNGSTGRCIWIFGPNAFVQNTLMWRGCQATVNISGNGAHIRKSQMHRTIGHGIYLNANSAIIEQNNITSIGEELTPATGPEKVGILIRGSSNIIRKNAIYEMEDSGIKVTAGDFNRIYNNVVWKNKKSGVILASESSGAATNNWFFNNAVGANNTDYSGTCGADSTFDTQFVLGLDWDDSDDGDGNRVFRNHIVPSDSSSSGSCNVYNINDNQVRLVGTQQDSMPVTWNNNRTAFIETDWRYGAGCIVTDYDCFVLTLQIGNHLGDRADFAAVVTGNPAHHSGGLQFVTDAYSFRVGDFVSVKHNGVSTEVTIVAITLPNQIEFSTVRAVGDSLHLDYFGARPDIGMSEWYSGGGGGGEPRDEDEITP